MSENNADNKVRLNKLISDCGVASRRAADRLIEEGLVTVNGKKVYELGIKVNPNTDRVTVEGKALKSGGQKIYAMFHKPKGVLTTMEDPLGRPTVSDYLEKIPFRVFPVGRLDWDSEGLLLLTNDGDFANKVTHPKKEVTKTYLVKLSGQPEPQHIEKLRRGVSIIGGKVSAKHIEKVKQSGEKKSSKYDWYKIIITEGKNRQIRQMFAKIGLDVMKLQRVSIGRLRLGALPVGELVFLNDAAVERIFMADLPDELKAIKKAHKTQGPRTGGGARAIADRKKIAKRDAKPSTRLRIKKTSSKTPTKRTAAE